MKLVDTKQGILYIGSKDDAVDLIENSNTLKFDVIWNLAKEFNFLLEDEQKRSYLVLLGNIPDYGIPENKKLFAKQLAKVVGLLKENGRVFVHCFGGHGRTGMALAAIKRKLDGMSAIEALAFANEQCQGPETEVQKQFIHSL